MILTFVCAAHAGDVEQARRILRDDGPDAAVVFVESALRQSHGYQELQDLKSVLDGALFAQAEAAGTVQGFEAYLRIRPDGANVPLARIRICAMDPRRPSCAAVGSPAPATIIAPGVQAPDPPARPALPSIDVPLRTGEKHPEDTAVVVGVEDYLFLPDVPFAARDADAFQDLLTLTRGIPADRVRRVTVASREQLELAVTEAGRETRPGGTVWVYFAGHGAAAPDSGERLLLGDDVRPDPQSFVSRGVGVKRLETLAAAGGGSPVVVLDACFTGRGRGNTELAPGLRFAVPTWAAGPQGTGAQWTATGPSEASGPLPGTDHGAFTYFAVGALRGWADGELDGQRDGAITGAEASAYVQRALRAAGVRAQQPVWAGPTELVLVRGASEDDPTPAR